MNRHASDSDAPTEDASAPSGAAESSARAASAGWNADPDTVILPVSEITSRKARRLAEQAAAEAAAQLVERSQPIVGSRTWAEDTMPLPRIGRHAGPPVSQPPSAGTGQEPERAPVDSARPALAPSDVQPSGRPPGAARTRAELRRRQQEAGRPPAARDASSGTGREGPDPRAVALRDGDPAPRHEARGILTGVRRSRGRLLVATLALLVVAATAGVVVVQVLSGRREQAPPAGRQVAAPQDTLLFAVEEEGKGLTSGAVIGVGSSGLGAVLVPGSLVLEVPGAGRSPLRGATAQGPDSAARALSDALRVRIDGTWTLTTSGLSALVDALGGIFVDVDQQVSLGTTVVPAGPGQRLAGVQAAAVAVAKADGETEEARLARFQQVMRGLLRALPATSAELGPLVSPRSGSSSTTLPVARLTDLLLRAHIAVTDGQESSSVVPLRAVAADGQTLYSLEEGTLRETVTRQLPGAVLAASTTGTIGVRLQNGVGVPGLNDAARDRLVAAGIRVEASGNAPTFGQARTKVLVRSGSAEDQGAGRRVADALGVPQAQIAVDQLGSGVVDVIVVLGEDFRESLIDEAVTTTP